MSPADREEVAQILRAELIKIFDLGALMGGGPATPLEENFLAYVSAVSKEHARMQITPAMKDAIDNALANTFDIFKTIHVMDEARIRDVLLNLLTDAARSAKRPTPRGVRASVDS